MPEAAPVSRAWPKAHIGRSMSLRVRLTLWVVAIFTLTWWTVGGLFWLYQRAAIRSVSDQRMLARARILATGIAPALPEISAAEIRKLATEQLSLNEYNRVEVKVLDRSMREVARWGVDEASELDMLAASEALQSRRPTLYSAPPGANAREDEFIERYTRVAAMAVQDRWGNLYAIVVTADDTLANEQAAILAKAMLVCAAIGPFAAGISGWFIAGVAVSPFKRLHSLTAVLTQQPSDSDLEFRGGSAEVQRLERELVQARARILERFAAQERFLSNVSHEIKTPLAVMITEAETLPRAGLPEHAAEFIDGVRDEMARLGRLVESFLTLARVQEGRVEAHTARYAVIDLVMDSLDNCRMMAKQHHVRLVPILNFTTDTDSEAELAGDPELLRTMLDNLIRNAIRFSPEEGTVRVEVQVNKRLAIIRVIDEGPGIPRDRIGTIFERFSQAHEHERRGRGHGLGLSISLGIAELHGGAVTVENRDPTGCEFIVFLPKSAATAPNSAPNVAESPAEQAHDNSEDEG